MDGLLDHDRVQALGGERDDRLLAQRLRRLAEEGGRLGGRSVGRQFRDHPGRRPASADTRTAGFSILARSWSERNGQGSRAPGHRRRASEPPPPANNPKPQLGCPEPETERQQSVRCPVEQRSECLDRPWNCRHHDLTRQRREPGPGVSHEDGVRGRPEHAEVRGAGCWMPGGGRTPATAPERESKKIAIAGRNVQ